MQKTYDVVIMGGGLAGLCLSIQLKKSKPDINILVLEKRETEAPKAAHKLVNQQLSWEVSIYVRYLP